MADNTLTAKERLAICKSCEKFIDITKICSVCYCFMPVKTRLPMVHCPENKW